MLNLPKTTEYNRRIPKQKFYQNINISPTLKRCFIEQIKVIYWRNKLASSTLNITSGSQVSEIQVFEIKLNTPSLDEKVLKQIDKELHYHIIFILEYENKYQLCVGYKEQSSSTNSVFKVNNYYYTKWMKETELSLQIDGLNTDTIYENFIRQIAGEKLSNIKDKTLKEIIEINEKKQQLQKQIDILQNKIKKEKQLNKQVQMNDELKKLKQELSDLNEYKSLSKDSE